MFTFCLLMLVCATVMSVDAEGWREKDLEAMYARLQQQTSRTCASGNASRTCGSTWCARVGSVDDAAADWRDCAVGDICALFVNAKLRTRTDNLGCFNNTTPALTAIDGRPWRVVCCCDNRNPTNRPCNGDVNLDNKSVVHYIAGAGFTTDGMVYQRADRTPYLTPDAPWTKGVSTTEEDKPDPPNGIVWMYKTVLDKQETATTTTDMGPTAEGEEESTTARGTAPTTYTYHASIFTVIAVTVLS